MHSLDSYNLSFIPVIQVLREFTLQHFILLSSSLTKERGL